MSIPLRTYAWYTLWRWQDQSLLLAGLLRHPSRLRAAPFLTELYRRFLGREIDPEGRRHYLHSMGQRSLRDRWRITRQILNSIEYSAQLIDRGARRGLSTLYTRRRLFLRLAPPLVEQATVAAHHRARMVMVRELPPASRILDLGGGSAAHASGALLGMGYPHRADEITIIDFPPGERMASSRSALKEDSHVTPAGTRIRFVYDSFTRLAGFTDGSFDLVFSGQTIEHITREEGCGVFADVFRLLKPGGLFCLDTPNRRLTELVCPGGFIHPEHKIEYRVEELEQMAGAAGFVVRRRLGISPMPRSDSGRCFDYREMALADGLCDDPRAGFSFYLELEKPVN